MKGPATTIATSSVDAAHAPDDHRHEGDEDRHEDARADPAEEVDAEVASDARWQPVRIGHGKEANGRYCALSPPCVARDRVRDAVDSRPAAVRIPRRGP